jgi:hypothetical protein
MGRMSFVSAAILAGIVVLLAGVSQAQEAATLTVSPEVSGPFVCGEMATLTYTYTPGVETPPIRGFNIRLLASAPLLVTPADVTFFVLPDTVEVFTDVLVNAANDLTISFAILGGTGQLDFTAEIFTLAVQGDDTGTGTVDFVSVTFRDLLNNPVVVEAGPPAAIEYICTIPNPVADLTATPGHNKIELSWTHDGSEADRFAVFRSFWYHQDTGLSTYPLYGLLQDDNVIPTRPESYAAAMDSVVWELLTVDEPIADLSYTDTWADGSARGLYAYEVFAIDAVQNVSLPAVAGATATNYWLGDVHPAEYDGLVDTADIHELAEVYGLCTGADGYDDECDIGPTDDWSAFGLPLPDACVDFEDLMIFAMNYGEVGPLLLQPVGSTVHLAWVTIAEGRHALRLTSGQGLQGLRLRAQLPPGTAVQVVAGDLLGQQGSPFFLHNLGPGLDVSLAVMGTGRSIVGEGNLFVVETPAVLSCADLVVTARSLDNTPLAVSFAQVTGVQTPPAFHLSANYPNPFNPLTTIRFALPDPQHVTLAVYGINGQRVALLASNQYAAGVHEIVWNGQDDAGRVVAAGPYFYRIDAGPYRQVKKMVLIK